VLLLLYGLRRGEALGLRWQDIDIEAQIIHIRQQIHRSQGSCASARSRPGLAAVISR